MFASTVAVAAGFAPDSAPFTAVLPGTYRGTATYSGESTTSRRSCGLRRPGRIRRRHHQAGHATIPTLASRDRARWRHPRNRGDQRREQPHRRSHLLPLGSRRAGLYVRTLHSPDPFCDRKRQLRHRSHGADLPGTYRGASSTAATPTTQQSTALWRPSRVGHRTAPHRTAPHRTAPHRTAAPRPAPPRPCLRLRRSGGRQRRCRQPARAGWHLHRPCLGHQPPGPAR